MHIYLSNFVLGHTYLKAVGSNFVYMESIRIVCKLDPYIVFVLLALIQSTFTDIIVKIYGIDAYPGISLCVVGQLYAYAMGTSSTCV